MTPAERKLLIWCGIMLVRRNQFTERRGESSLTPAEADEIDQLLVDVRSWDMWDSSRASVNDVFWRGFAIGLALTGVIALLAWWGFR